jgi:hypothetical protein
MGRADQGRRDSRVNARLGRIRSADDFGSLFAEMGFDPADEMVAWGGAQPEGALAARVIATAGESVFGDPFRVISLTLADVSLKLERQVIEHLRKIYPLALYLTTTSRPEREGFWRLVDVKSAAGGDDKRAIYRRMTIDAEGASRTIREQLVKIVVMPGDTPVQVAGNVRDAFDVEAVTKKFFRAFVDVFLAFKAAIAETPGLSPEQVRLEAQTLLDRLIFLYFIQRRGWLAGDKRFLYNAFSREHAAKPDENSYYSSFVAGLFLALSNKELNAEYPHRVPFLNGGLFDLDPFERTAASWRIKVPNRVFAKAFEDLFERYNFTVREDTPLDQEVAIDPEMLGKVFESLILEGEKANSDDDLRHATGSYYTPREVVHFMSRQAIASYLRSQFAKAYPQQAEDPWLPPRMNPWRAKDKVALLLSPGEFDYATKEDLAQVRAALTVGEAQFLKNAVLRLRVLDPAVGSGAFLIGALHELVNIVKVLDYCLDGPVERDPNYHYRLKRDAIGQGLYGVDIQEQAVRIAELRLWLSLAVDYVPKQTVSGQQGSIDDVSSIPTLPNLSYQVREGDTLSDQLFGIHINTRVNAVLDDNRTSRLLEPSIRRYRDLKASFFRESDALEKAKLEFQLTGLRLELAKALLEAEVKRSSVADNLFGRRSRAQQALAEQNAQARAALRQVEALQALAQEAAGPGEPGKMTSRLAKLRAELGSSFIWDVDFADIKADGGFDIVLANPPYLRQEAIDSLLGSGAKRRLQALYPRVGTGTADLYVYFYKRGFELLKVGGVLCFISSNKFMRAGYGEKLRAFLTGQEGEGNPKEVTLHTLIDFGDLPVFDATTYPMILIAEKRTPQENTAPRILTVTNLENLPNFEQYVEEQAKPLAQKRLSRSGWGLSDPEVLDLLDRLRAAGPTLGEFVQGKFYYGIKTGLNEAFVIDRARRDELIAANPRSAEIIKPFLRGRDVKQWRVNFANRYIIALQNSGDRDSTSPWRHERDEAKARAIFKNSYPAIHSHMSAYEARLRPRADQGRFWWELRACAYYHEFEKPKIVYPHFATRPIFAQDINGIYYGNDKTYIIPNPASWLIGVLNSSAIAAYFMSISPPVRGGFYEHRIIYLETIPIAQSSEPQRIKLESLVSKIIQAHKSPAGNAAYIAQLEGQINEIVFEMYGVNNARDRALIESVVGGTPTDEAVAVGDDD